MVFYSLDLKVVGGGISLQLQDNVGVHVLVGKAQVNPRAPTMK